MQTGQSRTRTHTQIRNNQGLYLTGTRGGSYGDMSVNLQSGGFSEAANKSVDVE